MSTTSRVREATIVIAEQIRANQEIALPDAVVGDDFEMYCRQVVHAALRKDVEAIKKNVRDAARSGGVGSVQLEIPGMDHASLPFIVFTKNADGEDVAVPVPLATKGQIRAEVTRQRRTVAVQDKVVSGWEATLDRLDALDVPDDWTGAEIAAQFPRALESE